ncbi:MAG: hypothetical protein AAFW87_03290 [Pseudomonadota bacterium]
MRLAFVHGINNEKYSADDIREMWWAAIEEGWTDIGLTPRPRPHIDVGYYANILADAVNGRGSQAVAQGGTVTTRAEGRAFLDAYLEAAGITEAEVRQALREDGIEQPEVVEQGRFQEMLVGVAGTVEKLLIGRGHWIASKFLTQATHYIEDPGLAAQIGLVVRKALFDGHDDRVVLVSHSLGTVVSYKMLAGDAKLKTREVPSFLTLGSPLGIGMMNAILPPRGQIPSPPIGEWTNAYRRDDFVALDRPLDPTTIGYGGITNVTEGLLEEADTHSIRAYLRSPPIAARIYAALE